MAEPSPDKIVLGTIGPLITTVIGAAIGWLPGGLTGAIGQPLTVLLAGVGGISGLVFSLMYKRYGAWVWCYSGTWSGRGLSDRQQRDRWINRFPAHTNYLDAVAVGQLLADRGFGQIRLTAHSACGRMPELGGHAHHCRRFVAGAFGQVGCNRGGTNQHKRSQHSTAHSRHHRRVSRASEARAPT
jgi:hypothetical protein